MTPEEIYKKKAAAVTSYDKLTAAQHLEAAAKLLRQEAKNDQVKSAFAEHRADKARAREKGAKIMAGIQKMKEEQVAQAFAGSDWVQCKEHNGVKTYCRKGQGGLYVNIKGDQYSITNGENTSNYTSVSGLGAFVAAEKKTRR